MVVGPAGGTARAMLAWVVDDAPAVFATAALWSLG
jgi:hypothetical protein